MQDSVKQPRLLLLSTEKGKFLGLNMFLGENGAEKRQLYTEKVKEQMNDIKGLKGNELYLNWLEKNHSRLDKQNHVVAMNLYSNDEALSLSNEKKKREMRNRLKERKFTLDGSLQPVHFGGGMASDKEFLLPEINALHKRNQVGAATERKLESDLSFAEF